MPEETDPIETRGFLFKFEREVQSARPYLVCNLETIRNELFQLQKEHFEF